MKNEKGEDVCEVCGKIIFLDEKFCSQECDDEDQFRKSDAEDQEIRFNYY
jgi:predicted nucleic acid-binding Zn ribbon protein